MHTGNCCLLLVLAVGEDTQDNQSKERHRENDRNYEGNTGLPGSTLLSHWTTDRSVRGWNKAGTNVALSYKR